MNLLEFVNPQAFWWGLLAVPIVVLYILKVRMRRQPVSTLLFWDQVFDEKKQRAWWQKLRHMMSLLLQLAFLLLLVAALVDPLWAWQKRQQRRIVLVVDNSASMLAADDDGKTRLDQAKQIGKNIIRGMRDRDEMAIFTAGGRVQVAVGLTSHQQTLTQTLDTIPATHTPTSLEEAVINARHLLEGSTNQQEIVVLTDGCTSIPEPLLNDKIITFYGIGKPLDNIAITSFQTRRSLTDVTSYQILLGVTNHGAEEAKVRVELTLADQIVDVLPLTIKPGETKSEVLDHISTTGGVLKAELTGDDQDKFTLDNVAEAILPSCQPIPVMLVTKGNLFLQQVLSSIPLVSLTVVETLPETVSSQMIVVFDREIPQDLKASRCLVVDPQNSCNLFEVGTPIDQPLVAKVTPDNDLTRHIHLENVLFPGARSITPKGSTTTLISDPQEDPLYLLSQTPTNKTLVLSCNLGDGDLPLRIAFPVLMKNAIEWFQGQSSHLQASVKTGQIFPINLAALQSKTSPTKPLASTTQPETTTTPTPAASTVELVTLDDDNSDDTVEWELISPGRELNSLFSKDGAALVGPFATTGVWTVAAKGTFEKTEPDPKQPAPPSTEAQSETYLIACNLADIEESNLRSDHKLASFVDGIGRSWGGRSFWFYLTLAGLCLTCTEWWLYQRRIVG